MMEVWLSFLDEAKVMMMTMMMIAEIQLLS